VHVVDVEMQTAFADARDTFAESRADFVVGLSAFVEMRLGFFDEPT
jgi:hypothetical protein